MLSHTLAFILTHLGVSQKPTHLQGAGEEVVLGDNVHKEVGRDLAKLVVQDGDEVDVEGVVLHHGLFWPAQKVQEPLPVLKGLVHIPQQEAHESKLELTWKVQRGEMNLRERSAGWLD